MKTEFLRKFLSDIKKLPNQQSRERLADLITSVEAAEELTDIPNLK